MYIYPSIHPSIHLSIYLSIYYIYNDDNIIILYNYYYIQGHY